MFHPWVRKIPWRREWLPTPFFLIQLHSHVCLLSPSPDPSFPPSTQVVESPIMGTSNLLFWVYGTQGLLSTTC